MSINANKARLLAMTKALSIEWRQTQEVWKDSKGVEFDRQYMQDLIAGMNSAVANIAELDKIITKVRDECE